MGRPVPAVERAIDVLELLADRPGQTLGLSEIAHQLGVNKASCHAIVTLLYDRGYLLRQAGKTYTLGPSILPLATTFLTEHDALSSARVQMNALSRDLGLVCVASTVIDDEIVILACTNPPASLGVQVRVGSRFALVPPLGTAFLAWAGPERIRDWLATVAASADARDHERYTAALARVRDRGYAVGFDRPRDSERAGPDRSVDFEDDALVEMAAAQSYPMMNIAAPIIDPEGTVQLNLTLVGFHEQMRAVEIPRLGHRLLEATAAVAQATWGPSEPPASRPRSATAPPPRPHRASRATTVP